MFQLLFAVSPAALECPFSVANRALSASNTLQMPRTMRPPDFLPLLTRKGKNMAGKRKIKGRKKRDEGSVKDRGAVVPFFESTQETTESFPSGVRYYGCIFHSVGN